MAIAEELQVVIRAEAERAIRDLRAFERQMGQTERSAGRLAQRMNDMGRTMTRAVTLPILGAAAASVKFAADIERQQTAFGVLLGDVERGNKLFQELKEFSAATPLQLEDITKASQTLLAFGTAAEDVQDQIRQLGDVAQGNAEKLDRITLAFGKIQARGKASMEEINVLIEAGVPIIAELAKNFGVAESEIFNMVSAGQVGFSDIQGALESLTGAGGQFEGMMEKISQTTAGKFSTAVDNLKLAAAELGAELLPMVNSALDRVTELAKGFASLDDETKKIILTVGAVTAAMGPMLRMVGSIGTAMSALAVPPTGYIIAAVAAVSLLTTGIVTLVRRWKENNEQIEMSSRLNENNNVILRNTKRAIDDVKLAQVGNIEAQYAYLQSLIDTNDAKEDINETELEYLIEERDMLQEILDTRGFLADRDNDRLLSLNRQITLLEADNEQLGISNELIAERIAELERLRNVESQTPFETPGTGGGGGGDDPAREMSEKVIAWYDFIKDYGIASLTAGLEAARDSAEALFDETAWDDTVFGNPKQSQVEQGINDMSDKMVQAFNEAKEAALGLQAAVEDIGVVATTTGSELAYAFGETFANAADDIQRVKDEMIDLVVSVGTVTGSVFAEAMDTGEVNIRGLITGLTDIFAPGLGQIAGVAFDIVSGLFDMAMRDFNARVEDAAAEAQDFVVELDDAYETELEIRNRYIDELNDTFNTEFDILRDLWDRNLISTDEFRTGMGELSDDYAQGVDDAEAAAAVDAANDLEAARAEKIGGLQAQIDRIEALWEAEFGGAKAWKKLFSSKDEEWAAQMDVLRSRIKIAQEATTLSGIQAAAKGANFMTDGPQLLLVGDNASGREHVQVTPAEGGGMGGGPNIYITGPVYGVDDLGERVYAALEQAKRRGRIPT